MRAISKTEALTITQAKLIRKDGTVEYYFSKPKIKFLDIKGRLWVRRRIKQMKEERI